VGSVSRHGPSSSEDPALRSILKARPVRSRGPTPHRGSHRPPPPLVPSAAFVNTVSAAANCCLLSRVKSSRVRSPSHLSEGPPRTPGACLPAGHFRAQFLHHPRPVPGVPRRQSARLRCEQPRPPDLPREGHPHCKSHLPWLSPIRSGRNRSRAEPLKRLRDGSPDPTSILATGSGILHRFGPRNPRSSAVLACALVACIIGSGTPLWFRLGVRGIT
jgi:hypothetical protein